MLRRISLAAAALLTAVPALAAVPNDAEPRALTVRTGQGQVVTIAIPPARAEAPYTLTGTAKVGVSRSVRLGQGNWAAVPTALP